MSFSCESTERCILATVVLYGKAPAQSQSLCSLLGILGANPDLAMLFSVILYDNSPEQHTIDSSVSIPVTYIHQPRNAGLAAAYNFALAHAEENRQDWLLLLDQDTTLTLDFLRELADCIPRLRKNNEIASIIPKLILGTRILSPQTSLVDQIRHQYIRLYGAVKHDLVGIQQHELAAYNSGATLRVSALRSVGAFPEAFWLDYLDHAVFHALWAANFRMYVMRSALTHEASQASLGDVPEWRQRNVLMAQTLFVKQTGTFVDLLLYRIWVLRHMRILWLRSPHRRLWKEALLHALFLRTETDKPVKS